MQNYVRCILLLLWFGLHGTLRTIKEVRAEIDVDKFISDYVQEVTRTLKLTEQEHNIRKRSPSELPLHEIEGVNILVGFTEVFALPSKFPNDMVLFSSCSPKARTDQPLFAATLETNVVEPWRSASNDLVLYKYDGKVWVEKDRVHVEGGVRLASQQVGDFVYIIVAEYLAADDRGSTVFFVNSVTSRLQFVHMLNTHCPSHVIMWEWENLEAFAAVAIAQNPPGSKKPYSTQSPVYRWLGSHFDMIGTLPTHNPQALTQFRIRSSTFIAVANFQDDFGDTLVSSDIFRYDLAAGVFTLYQKLPTEAAVDIKHFCFQGSEVTENFIIYASAFHKDEEGKKDYNAASVVYKMSDQEYFVPFQALRVPKVTSWMPVQYSKDKKGTLILLAASEDGVTSFQYDGWKFRPTGVYFDEGNFGPGFKSFSVFYNGDQTLISVANKRSVSYEASVFRPVFTEDSRVEQLRQRMYEWQSRMAREVPRARARVAALMAVAKAAPSTTDPVIQLDSPIVFHDVDIGQAESYTTRVGDSNEDMLTIRELYQLNTQLDLLKHDLAQLQARIDETTVHTHTNYQALDLPSASIHCEPYCQTEFLVVSRMNGENYTEFLANTVNISEPVELDGELTFEQLAVIDPLDVQLINGHKAESLIDWSKEVVTDQELKVEGDVVLNDNLSVGGSFAGVTMQPDSDKATDDEVINANTKVLDTLNTAQLILPDGQLSQQDFRQFSENTLKTTGDQIITEMQDFDRIEADEVVAYNGVYRTNIPFPSPYRTPLCVGKFCETRNARVDHDNILRTPESGSFLDFSSETEEELIVEEDVILDGKVVIHMGSLSAADIIDLKHNVSAQRIMEFGIHVNESTIDKLVEIDGDFKAANIDVDTLNGVDVASLVTVDSLAPTVVTGRKEFKGDLMVNGAMEVTGTVNGVNLSQPEEPVRTFDELTLESLHVVRVDSSDITVGGRDYVDLLRSEEDGRIKVERLQVVGDMEVDTLKVQGLVNDIDLDKMLEDTVYEDGNVYTVSGEKSFTNGVKISKLTATSVNGVSVDELTPESVWRRRLEQAKTVAVDKLTYEGLLDGVKSDEFGMWLLTEGDQTVLGSQMIDSWQAADVVVPPEGSFIGVNIRQLLAEAVLLSDNVTLGQVSFDSEVWSSHVTVGGLLNGLAVPEDIMLSGLGSSQHVTAHKQVLGSVTVDGSFSADSHLSSVDLKAYCHALSQNYTKLIIKGNASFKEEPNIVTSINGKNWVDLIEHTWFKEDNLTVDTVMMRAAHFDQLDVETINNNNVEEKLSQLVSASEDQIINGTFYFSTVDMEEGLEAERVTVSGLVQGLRLESFVDNVLLDGEDQELWGVPDFSQITIDGGLKTEGLVNSLNLSKDVMLTNVASNTVAQLRVDDLTVGKLWLPNGALVSGVDLDKWNKTAIKRSASDHLIRGNIVFEGQLDFVTGIRVEGLVNGVPYDRQNLLLVEGPQYVGGLKTFSSEAHLKISHLKVGGFINSINITDFYRQLVNTTSDVTLTGHKTFTSAVRSGQAVLPEVYQGYNLTWLETVAASTLPWTQYELQMAKMADKLQLAQLSLAGKPYYLKSLNRMRDLEGRVLTAFPLRSEDTTVLATVRAEGKQTTLTLLHWNTKYHTFLPFPGSVQNVLKVAPSSVGSLALSGERIAAYVTSFTPSPDNSSHSEGVGEFFTLKDGSINHSFIHGGRPGTRLLAFQDESARPCTVLVTQDLCRVHCLTERGRRVRLPSFSCQNITEATMLTTDKAVFLLGLQTGSYSALVMWRMEGKRFSQLLAEPQFNPVSIAATTTSGPHIAVVNRVREDSSRPEHINLYRFDEESFELELEQSLPSVYPKKVLFATLPTKETLMYVLSDYPVWSLKVFVYRGIQGYIQFEQKLDLPVVSDIHAFSDHQRRHFLVVTSGDRGLVVQAQFEGESDI